MSKQDTGAEIVIPRYPSFSTVPNTFLRDERVSLKARGLMTTLFSFPDTWRFSIKGLMAILPDGEASIRSSIKELEKYGYMKMYRERNEKGQLGASKYVVIPEPKRDVTPSDDVPMRQKKPKRENPHLDIFPLKNPDVENPVVENPPVENPDVENRGQLNTNILNTKEYKDELVCLSVNRTREIVEHNINYQSLLSQIKFYEKDLLNSIVDIMVDTYEHAAKIITLRNREYTREEVIKALNETEEQHILDIIEYIRDYQFKIHNPHNFVLTLLLQGKFGQDPYWSSRVKNDMRG